MENKNTYQMLLVLVAGFFVGWLVFGSNGTPNNNTGGSMMMDHEMSMESMMDSMNAGLMGKSGDEFNKAFIEEMIVHHQGAVMMAQMVLQKSERPEMISLANDIIKAQTNEIDMMQGWHEAWFK
jgi:uncharacterized protein (DUF305 family)